MMVDQPKYKTSDEVDFVIIGSGAAGGILAKELSTNGFRVVVLEQGPYLTESDFTHNEVEIFAPDEAPASIVASVFSLAARLAQNPARSLPPSERRNAPAAAKFVPILMCIASKPMPLAAPWGPSTSMTSATRTCKKPKPLWFVPTVRKLRASYCSLPASSFPRASRIPAAWLGST